MFNTSSIELNRRAFANNLQQIKSIIGSNVKFSSVIKGNAYGHGIQEMVKIIEAAGVDHFSVFDAEEALTVVECMSSDSTVMIMGYLGNEEIEWAIKNEVEFFVFEIDRVEKALEIAKKTNSKARIHLEVETGLNRTGFPKKELQHVLSLIKDNEEYFSVEGLCTHYAGAESVANHVRVTNQIKRFNQFDKMLRNKGVEPKLRHTACSAAAVSYPKSRMDMVRIGILQYGYWPSRETFIFHLRSTNERFDPLKRVITWKSHVMDTKAVQTGEFIGYGTTFLAPDNMKIATVPVGYSHGYARNLSNQGRVLIRGHRLAVIGIVNMNLVMVDISECPEVEKGDEVVLIGNQGENEVSVASFGELSNQLNYELLSRLPHNIPRKIIDKEILVD